MKPQLPIVIVMVANYYGHECPLLWPLSITMATTAFDYSHNCQYNTIQYNIRLMKKIPADTAATEITK